MKYIGHVSAPGKDGRENDAVSGQQREVECRLTPEPTSCCHRREKLEAVMSESKTLNKSLRIGWY